MTTARSMTCDLSTARVALFVPCYVDQLAPRVGFAALRLLRRFGIEPELPAAVSCCGQPMANMGCASEATPLARSFAEVLSAFDYVVCPSGSCTAMVRQHYPDLLGSAASSGVCARTYELCEFLVDVLRVEHIGGTFRHRVGLHESCHGLRGLRLGSGSERVVPRRAPVADLLSTIEGLELVDLERVDECCGFGGTFAVTESGVSTMMGEDRLRDHDRAGAEVIASVDMSCLLHLGGLLTRRGGGMRVMHVAEILAASGEAT
jgi:L-lactate dehydrogenase complex protein LldE